MDRADVFAKLEELSRLDPEREYFGSKGHDYRLNPVLTEQAVADLEARHRFSLPPEYRAFVTTIGNGGAGPYYGVFPLGLQSSPRELGPWDEQLGDLSKPFPHTSAWNLPPEFWAEQPDPPDGTPAEEEDRLNEEWDAKLAKSYWRTDVVNGAIPVTDMGCALGNILIVAGQEAGTIWEDLRADYRGIVPVTDEAGRHLSFGEWYKKWLSEGLARFANRPPPLPRVAVRQPWWRSVFKSPK